MKKLALLLSVFMCLVLLCGTTFAGNSVIEKSKGQVVYLPVVYNNFSGDLYAITRIVIRNIDLNTPITVTSVKFYDPDGNFVSDFITTDETVNPLATTTFLLHSSTLLVEMYDSEDDARPSVLVEWESDQKVNSPIIESARCFVLPGNVPSLDITPGTVIQERHGK